MTRQKEAVQMAGSARKCQIRRILEDDAIPPLIVDLRELSMAIKDLEAQLRRFIRINQALESDLVDAHRQVMNLTEERDNLVRRIEKMEEKAVPLEEMREEVKQLQKERDAMAAKVSDLARALASSEHGVHEIMQLKDRFRAERDDASEEAACLNAQFSRAMEKIEELRRELDAHREQKEVIEAHVKLLREQLHTTAGQHSSLG